MTPPRHRLAQDERLRQRAFALAAALLIAAAVALNATRPDHDATRPDHDASRAVSAPATTVVGSSPPSSAIDRVLPAVRPSAPVAPARRLRRVARRFLAGYLPYLYGQWPTHRIRGASVRLRRRLVADRLRVPPAARRRRPRVHRLDVGQRVHDAHAWKVTARVADGGIAIYPIELLIGVRHGRLLVTALGGE